MTDQQVVASARQKFHCPACGAEADWTPAKQALICPFCGAESPATLQTRGASTVIVEHDLAEALRAIQHEPPDLMVLDLEMPEMHGVEVLRAIRSNPATAHLPVLVLTASANESATRAGFEAGATDYLTKPFSIPQLTARVHACLARADHTRRKQPSIS